jgi:hypothetical protein
MKWRHKPLHGRYANELRKPSINVDASIQWLTRGYLFPETEGFIIAIQDQVVATRNYLKYIVKDPNTSDDKCRRCGTMQETVQHILAGCTMLAQTAYKNRHDNVGKIVHQQLIKYYKIGEPNEPYYKYEPAKIIHKNNIKIYWDRTILTDQTIPHNRPDIIIHNQINNTAIMIDFAVVDNNNLDSIYTTKIQKYVALSQEIKDLWNLENTKTIPVIISTTGLIPRNTIQALQDLHIPQALLQIQKSAILDSCRIVREFLQ